MWRVFWDIYESKQHYIQQKCEEEIMVSSEMTDIGINTFYLIFYDCKYNNEN